MQIEIPTEEIEEEIIYPTIPRGRPKKYEDLTKEQYNKMYYKNNKQNTKGNCICEICKFMVSKSNKSRHHKSKIHLQNAGNQGSPATPPFYLIVDSYQEKIDDEGECLFCGWMSEFENSHLEHCGGGCAYIREKYDITFEDGEIKGILKKT